MIYSYFKENVFTAAKMDTKMSTRYVKGVPFINTKYRKGYVFSQKGDLFLKEINGFMLNVTD